MQLRALACFLLLAFSSAAETVRLGRDVVPASQAVTLEADPRSDSYRGTTTIALEVKKATTAFRMHAIDLTIDSMTLTKGGDPVGVIQAAGEDGTILVTAEKQLAPGSYTLAISFTNKFNRQAVGLYKMEMKGGEPYLFTQFQAIDARRAFPCFDEPSIKIPYELTVAIPVQYDAISNTPVANESATAETKIIRFATTKPLPSYLIALAVGKFDYTPIPGMSVPGRVIAPKGQGHLTHVAAAVTPRILAALEEYFGSKHPFEKVDLIAVPEYWAGAMENPGAITFRDTVLLLDEKTATPAARQNMIRINAHELAHMWFGDLVTMEWWDDFWLNESFADWMGDKITAQLFPEFGHEMSEMGNIQYVMHTDARATTDPIRRTNSSPEEAMDNVGVAYNKGKAVLSMFEQWIGPEPFRQGVLAHLKANAWSNANASEFFASLAKHAPKGTAEALQSFVTQPGIPLVNVEILSPTEVRLTQSRFTNGASIAAAPWRIPVTLRHANGVTPVMLDAPSKTVKLDKAVTWIYPHANAAGYYRWQLPQDAMTTLAARAGEVLAPKERLAFVGNVGALFSNGTLHGDVYLDVVSRFTSDSDPQVLSMAVGAVTNARFTFDSPETRPLFTALIRKTLRPTLDRIGFTPKPGESEKLTILRPEVLSLLGQFGEDAEVRAFAKETLAKYLADPTSVHPTIAGTAVTLSAMSGDEALFEEYRKRFEAAAIPAERQRFLVGLARFRDPKLRLKAREYAFTGPVRPQELGVLFTGGQTAEERDETFAFVTSRYDEIVKRIPPSYTANMPFMASGCEPVRVEKAREFFASHKVEGTDRALERVTEQVNECATLRTREMAAVTKYLRKQD
ncbi:MAG TPA: M1 family metallopeptidase [Thermoanaerobaculia bacterium]|nr:M1 family metallopeptidase [Thermoanaerobaculia bacterium]